MSDRYVFDTEAIIAYLYDEPGRSVVEAYLRDVRDGVVEGLLAETNAGEVLYLVARFEGIDDKPTTDSLRTADRDLRALERWGISIERADWRLAAEVKADGHISFADAHGVTLAHESDATLITGADDDFETLPVDVDVVRFRENSV
ncbi:PIN domain-containing protein [Natrialba swarupiae]|uniref:Type II toxin-antitoxin system VapC family toxin n=1 Tax=Natrialba swarupiae TaxID=2448032 RepID=A0A5D5APM0_9EURY|nr:PIN domain-containing protein [Natrialba swarupiae]MCW8173426.1 PIN domain-containing protein [Natrialba swarupiae]TYT61692.1 type II toxin-antitoxin system VapC family toxin [Natrialba swarupiae]